MWQIGDGGAREGWRSFLKPKGADSLRRPRMCLNPDAARLAGRLLVAEIEAFARHGNEKPDALDIHVFRSERGPISIA